MGVDFVIELSNGEKISMELIESISEEIIKVLKPKQLTLPAAQYVLKAVSDKISLTAIVK